MEDKNMKKYLYILLTTLMLPPSVSADYIEGTVNLTLNGNTQAAVARLDATNHIALLGNGYNACIPFWSVGDLVIPATVDIDGTTYTVEPGPVAFRLCTNLTSITLEEGMKHIGAYAFVGCSAVKDIQIPSTMTSIARGAFVNMKSLNNVVSNATQAPAWEWNDVFSSPGTIKSMENMAASRVLYVPEGRVADYTGKLFADTIGYVHAFRRIYERSDKPQTISTVEELVEFRNAVNNGNRYKGSTNKSVTLTADLDLKDLEWTPIGTEAHPFDGVFNGDGHVIKNLKCNVSQNYVGLFGRAKKAIIYNMHLLNPQVSGRDYVGSVLGYAEDGTNVTDVLVTSNASSGADYTVSATSGSGGGIVGFAVTGNIARCMFHGQVKCTGWAGGIVGNINYHTVIQDCSASNFIQNVSTGDGSYVGGIIVGRYNGTTNSSIKDCVYWVNGEGIGGKDYYAYNMVGSEGSITYTITGYNHYNTQSDMTQDKTKTVLGDDNWYYFTGNYIDYPVPLTLKEMYLRNVVTTTDDNGLVYNPVGNDPANPTAYEVAGYTGTATSITIPDTYKDKPVTAILENALEGSIIESVTIGSNVTTIGAGAFAFCDALTAFDMPDGVTTLGEGAFLGCENLTSFNIGKGFKDHTGNFITYCPKLTTLTASRGNDNGYICVDNVLLHNVGEYRSFVVACAPGKTGDYVLPIDDLTNLDIAISTNCFTSCTELTSITFPAGRRYSLGARLFEDADNLRYVDMSKMSKTINDERYTIKRSEVDNPFFGMSESTMIYLHAYHARGTGEVNAVIANQALSVELTDDWDFTPPVYFSATDVTINRELSAEKTTVFHAVTDSNGDIVYQKDENGNPITVPVYDDDGNDTGEWINMPEWSGEEEYVVNGHTVCLPYDLTLTAENAKVYAPTKIEEVNGVPTITFTEVDDMAMKAYKPYYVTVEGEEAVSLNSDTNTTIYQVPTDEPEVLDGFCFKGTTVNISNDKLHDDGKPVYVLSEDGT